MAWCCLKAQGLYLFTFTLPITFALEQAFGLSIYKDEKEMS